MTNWNTSTSRSATFRFFLRVVGRLPCCSHRHKHIIAYGLGHVQPSLYRQPSSSATHPVDQALSSCLANLHSTDHGHVPKNGVNINNFKYCHGRYLKWQICLVLANLKQKLTMLYFPGPIPLSPSICHSCLQKSNQLLCSYRVHDIILHSLGYFI